jgi:hypothetical protein
VISNIPIIITFFIFNEAQEIVRDDVTKDKEDNYNSEEDK